MDEIKTPDAAGQLPALPNEDEDTSEYAALLADISELKDAETEVQHMDIGIYRKGRRPCATAI